MTTAITCYVYGEPRRVDVSESHPLATAQAVQQLLGGSRPRTLAEHPNDVMIDNAQLRRLLALAVKACDGREVPS